MKGQRERIIKVDFSDQEVLTPLLARIMKRLPGIMLRSYLEEEGVDQTTIQVTALGKEEELGFFLDEAEEMLQCELDAIGQTIVFRPSLDDWGTE